jgi:glutamyl-Q tRNA(Asp) synthetase
MPTGTYRGRFAPSPTGPLHAGSLAAALASWLDARAHGGQWLVRIEDIDPPRELAGASQEIIDTLAGFGLESDLPVVWQRERGAAYADALARLTRAGLAYPCACSRREVELAAQQRGLAAGVYPGTCRPGACRPGACGPGPHAIRLRVPDPPDDLIVFIDRAAGSQRQALAEAVGDFVLQRADGLWSYQLAVVVDDAAAGITDIVRGADLLDNTPRQIWLQRCLGLPSPRTLHVPLVRNAAGEKLSKQTGARALDRADVLGELRRAWTHLGFAPLQAGSRDAFLREATVRWGERSLAGSPAYNAGSSD